MLINFIMVIMYVYMNSYVHIHIYMYIHIYIYACALNCGLECGSIAEQLPSVHKALHWIPSTAKRKEKQPH
jgi:hypothetical protein